MCLKGKTVFWDRSLGRRTCRIRGTENKQTRKRVEKIERPNGQDERRPSKEFVETKSFENFKTKETVSNLELSNINQTIYLIGPINLSVIFKVILVPTKNYFFFLMVYSY